MEQYCGMLRKLRNVGYSLDYASTVKFSERYGYLVKGPFVDPRMIRFCKLLPPPARIKSSLVNRVAAMLAS